MVSIIQPYILLIDRMDRHIMFFDHLVQLLHVDLFFEVWQLYLLTEMFFQLSIFSLMNRFEVSTAIATILLWYSILTYYIIVADLVLLLVLDLLFQIIANHLSVVFFLLIELLYKFRNLFDLLVLLLLHINPIKLFLILLHLFLILLLFLNVVHLILLLFTPNIIINHTKYILSIITSFSFSFFSHYHYHHHHYQFSVLLSFWVTSLLTTSPSTICYIGPIFWHLPLSNFC